MVVSTPAPPVGSDGSGRANIQRQGKNRQIGKKPEAQLD